MPAAANWIILPPLLAMVAVEKIQQCYVKNSGSTADAIIRQAFLALFSCKIPGAAQGYA